MNSQYAFGLSFPAVFVEENFYVCDCNREAHQWVNAWPNWPSFALVLYGDAGSGKSHLGHIWAKKSGASTSGMPDAKTHMGNALVEDIERISDERALLHLINKAKEQGDTLLLTSAMPPKQLPFTLPDLVSRLRALPTAGIAPPDEEALAAVMRKQFADRQMKVQDEVMAYLLPRMERSFAQVSALVESLDAQSLTQRKNLTIPFLKRLGY